MKIIVIVPAYNEENCLSPVLHSLLQLDPPLDIIVVDDASEDDTVNIARKQNVPCIPLPLNLGTGGAVKAGYKYAVENGYEIALQFDSDGQHDAEQIGSVLKPIVDGKAEMVIGSRFINKTGYQSEWLRRIGIHFFSFLTGKVINVKITDLTSGFRAIGGHLLPLFARAYPDESSDVEALILASRSGARIVEVPVEMKPRLSGNSFFNLKQKLIYPIFRLISLFVTLFRTKQQYRID